MRNKRYIILTFFLLICINLYSQTIAFKAKVVHNKKGIMKNFSILVNSEIATTNDAGIFVIPLKDDLTHTNVTLLQTNYTVLYPTGGYLSVPRDLNDAPEIIIGSPQDDIYLNQYLAIRKEINSNNSLTTSELSELNKEMDSLRQDMLKLNYTKSDLETAEEMQNGRDRNYAEISENLNEFVSRAIDIGVNFKYVSEVAASSSVALDKLKDAVKDYNNIYNKLNQHRKSYENSIISNWRNDSLTKKYQNLISYALDSLHGNTMYLFQNDIETINQYSLKYGKDNNLKEQIHRDVSAHLKILEPMMLNLRLKNNEFQQIFSN